MNFDGLPPLPMSPAAPRVGHTGPFHDPQGQAWQRAMQRAQLAGWLSQGVSGATGWQLLPPMGLGVEPPALPLQTMATAPVTPAAPEHADGPAANAMPLHRIASPLSTLLESFAPAHVTVAAVPLPSGEAAIEESHTVSCEPGQFASAALPFGASEGARDSIALLTTANGSATGAAPQQGRGAPASASARAQTCESAEANPARSGRRIDARTDPRTAPQPPVRLHADWSSEGVRLWLALDAARLPQAAAIATQVHRFMAAQGLRVLAFHCNGEPLDPGGAASFDKENTCPSAP
ncbi:MAG TPA: hypothetical protein VHA82_20090 [Ramlibacter sp.]|uniref:hypothetical protein n=1 Tax=Ramlibacter sp. TaxID=1917967 RepID=UPI002C4AD0F4|nr:hypothetical protein [Ramlibacter sp.]HVZ46118.1 hypothetical protein [Ramlibacter sp.]